MAYDKPFEQKPNTGSLFHTKEKKSEKSPDYFGDVLVNVNDIEPDANGYFKLRLSGWKNVSEKTGTVYLSLKLDKPMEAGGYRSEAAPRSPTPYRKPAAYPAEGMAGIDDSIPF